jgi:ferritin-like metal-binding protein YciE
MIPEQLPPGDPARLFLFCLPPNTPEVSMDIDSLEKLFAHELKDLWSAENQILKALPKMAEKASNPELRQAFELHHRQTEEQVRRLEQIFDTLEFQPGGHKCKGMEGLIEEGEDVMDDAENDDVRDAGMIAAAQRVEHYEIAAYGTARTYAKMLGRDDAAQLLQQTLDEEGETDKKLTSLAESRVNPRAMES